MKNFVEPGETITIAAPGATVAGQMAHQGLAVGVAVNDAANGAPVEIVMRGVFDLAKTSAQEWTVGAAIYYIPATRLLTTATTAGNILVGVAVAAAANPSATGRVRLDGAARVAQ